MASKEIQEKKFIFNSKLIEEISQKINDGYVIKRFQNPWFKNEIGVRRNNITFAITDREWEEYIKCKMDIHYFAEKYCMVKTEDGSIGNIRLRDYQNDILDLFEGRFSILCASRQIGKCLCFNSLVEIENMGKIRVGELYYQIVSQFRKLTFIEKIKIKIYTLIYRLEGKHKIRFFKNKKINLLYSIVRLIEKYEYKNINLDEDDINKKIINTFSNLDIKVASDSGYVQATDIHLTQPYTIYKVGLENGYTLECADIHILFNENHNQVYCKDLKLGNLIQTDIGPSKVVDLIKSNKKVSMFDISIGHKDHRYYTNGILSHNTVSTAIKMLHFVTFNNDKNIMIVANVANTTIEIIEKVKSIYINLPFFLKVGVKNWNQRSIVFDNGCRIKSSARTKTPAIGFTIDFLYLDEFAHIPSNIIVPYYTAVFPVVSAVENSKIIITSTPNQMNLFYKLLTDAERPDGDSQKNNYRAMRVYWYQVPGRFVTYYRLNKHKMSELGISSEEVLRQVKEEFGDITKVEMIFNKDLQKDVIYVYNNDLCTDAMAKAFQFIDANKDNLQIPIQMISETTTWKEEATKDIGGEDAFNQEYGLRFINSSRSLLDEATIEGLMGSKRNYVYEEIFDFQKKLRFSYSDLKWIDDDNIFMPIQRKSIKGIMSIDISEGLGLDYSVINIFKITAKSRDIIESQKHTYTNISDFFCLTQIGMYRSNFISVKQLAELFYMLAFEYFHYDNFKAVLEINTYGNEFLAHLPHVFEGNNNYGSNVFFRYKHKIDAEDDKIGIKIGENKNMLVRDYQEAMSKKRFLITNEDSVREITTFVKHITPSGNIRYAADIGNDDTVMTLVNTSSIFTKFEYKAMVEENAASIVDTETMNYFNIVLKQVEYKETADYSSIININRQRRLAKQFQSGIEKNGSNWFSGNWGSI